MEKTEKTYTEQMADVFNRRKVRIDKGEHPTSKESDATEKLIQECAAHAGRLWQDKDVLAQLTAWVNADVDCSTLVVRPQFWLERLADVADRTKKFGPQSDLPPGQ